MRVRVLFAKTEAMRYTGHLDLFRTWERTIRRAKLPLAYSQGYRPRPRINLASALPLGITSQSEIIDIWFEESVSLETIQHSLQEASPPGIEVLEIHPVGLEEPSLQSTLESAEYEILFQVHIPDLEQRIDLLMRADSWPSERRGKTYDLRPLIQDLRRLREDDQGHPRLFLKLSAMENATGRPDEVIRALGGAPETVNVHRTSLIFDHGQTTSNPDGVSS